MRDMGIELKTVKAGYANMFLSPLFAEAFATVTNSTVELYNTDGSQGTPAGQASVQEFTKSPKTRLSAWNRSKPSSRIKNSETSLRKSL